MNQKEIIIQIFTGGYEKQELSDDIIAEKIEKILQSFQVHKIIIGWSLETKLYHRIETLARKYNAEYFLWFPVFSESQLLKSMTPSIDFKGEEVEAYYLNENESFRFCCPKEKRNQNSIIEILEEKFSAIQFDGVFLDKIRYGSFSNGIESVFSCFCPQCQKVYKDNHIDIKQLKKELQKIIFQEEGYEEQPLKITSYENGNYQFESEILQKFFKVKGKIIYEALLPICQYLRRKNLKIGLDTFSPHISYFAGQDIELLAGLTDFIKPMMYRITQAPAGLPFESSKLIYETTKNQENEEIFKIWNCENKEIFDIEFVKRELEYMTNLSDIYCGIEVNKLDICDTTVQYIRENLEELSKTDIKGFVLSWNVIMAPEENLKAVKEYFNP